MSKTEFEASMDRHLEGAAGPAATPAPPRNVLSDSVSDMLYLCQELLQGMPRSAQVRARKAAHNIEVAFMATRTEAPKDPAVALGTLFALTYILDQLIQNSTNESSMDGNLIQLLS